MLVSKNPVVSWWDACRLSSTPPSLGCLREEVSTQASLERWSTEGISEITWEEAPGITCEISNGIGFSVLASCVICVVKRLEDTRKISFFTARLASFSITQDDECMQ